MVGDFKTEEFVLKSLAPKTEIKLQDKVQPH